MSQFASSAVGTVAFGALSGGIGAELSGGNFWQGAVIGGIVAGLNHAMHKMNSPFDNDEGEDPPGKGKKTTANKIKYGAKVGKEIGASAEFIDAMDKSLKGNSKILGKFGKVGGYLSAGGQIIYDGVEYINGEISGYRFSFRLGATVTSYVAGMEVGAAIGGTAGGPAGFVVGTTIGVGAGVTESAWDTWWPQFKHSYNNFINTAISNWMRYR